MSDDEMNDKTTWSSQNLISWCMFWIFDRELEFDFGIANNQPEN
ncbi:2588_t:CDS:1, partial [Cetraspora pellucida]